MLQIDMNANVRSSHGKGAARVLRGKGMTPAVVYGPGVEPVSLELDTKSFTKNLLAINRRNALINLDVIEGKKKKTRHVVIKELQTDPINDSLLHADFCEVSLKDSVILNVPIELLGNAKGADLGGVVQVGMTKVQMKGKILDFPDIISLDITNLAINDGMTCKDIPIPANMQILDAEVSQVVFIADPSTVKSVDLEEEEAAEEAGAAEVAEGAGEETVAE